MLDHSLYVLPVGRQDFGPVNPEIRIIEGRMIEVLLYFVYLCILQLTQQKENVKNYSVDAANILLKADSLSFSRFYVILV